MVTPSRQYFSNLLCTQIHTIRLVLLDFTDIVIQRSIAQKHIITQLLEMIQDQHTMSINIKRMISDWLDDLLVVCESRKQVSEYLCLIEQRNESKWIMSSKDFVALLLDTLFGDLLDEMSMFLK